MYLVAHPCIDKTFDFENGYTLLSGLMVFLTSLLFIGARGLIPFIVPLFALFVGACGLIPVVVPLFALFVGARGLIPVVVPLFA
ncbi:MAG: hypothetical protein O3B25_07125, partial [Verrucomicrobia bacterium]|nr:hypothetical protein [Verrucomicrobiota bacterium]